VAFVSYSLKQPLLAASLIGLNTATLFLFGFDKWAAMQYRLRIPERTFFRLAIIGSTPAILLGMKLFRHKTRDRSFTPKFVSIFVLQLVVGILLYKL